MNVGYKKKKKALSFFLYEKINVKLKNTNAFEMGKLKDENNHHESWHKVKILVTIKIYVHSKKK